MVKSRPEGCQGEPIGVTLRRPVTLGGQRRSDGRARQVFGDGMHGRSCGVNQGDLPEARWEFIAQGVGTKSPPVRSQSTHRSEEAG